MNQFKKYQWLILIIIIAGSFLAWGKFNQATIVTFWPNTNIACLNNGHTNINLHIHSELSIKVKGQTLAIPANIGILPNCMAEVHTHDEVGKVHIESLSKERKITLGDFFAVWGKDFSDTKFMDHDLVAGDSLKLYVNGQEEKSLNEYILKDNEKLEIILE